jgi:hypothetical protein
MSSCQQICQVVFAVLCRSWNVHENVGPEPGSSKVNRIGFVSTEPLCLVTPHRTIGARRNNALPKFITPKIQNRTLRN